MSVQQLAREAQIAAQLAQFRDYPTDLASGALFVPFP